MSVTLQVELAGIKRLQKRIAAIGDIDRRQLMDIAGAEVESQTRRRITDEKYGPDGTQWPGWLDSYAKTRKPHHSLLESEGHLVDSITHIATADHAEIGSNLIYAATHQHGDEDRNIEARPYLGLSDENEGDVIALIDDFIDGHLAKVARI